MGPAKADHSAAVREGTRPFHMLSSSLVRALGPVYYRPQSQGLISTARACSAGRGDSCNNTLRTSGIRGPRSKAGPLFKSRDRAGF